MGSVPSVPALHRGGPVLHYPCAFGSLETNSFENGLGGLKHSV